MTERHHKRPEDRSVDDPLFSEMATSMARLTEVLESQPTRKTVTEPAGDRLVSEIERARAECDLGNWWQASKILTELLESLK